MSNLILCWSLFRFDLTDCFFRVQVKGNVYKNKRVLMEAVHKQKAEKIREKTISDQLEARRSKNKATRERKGARREERLAAVSGRRLGFYENMKYLFERDELFIIISMPTLT